MTYAPVFPGRAQIKNAGLSFGKNGVLLKNYEASATTQTYQFPVQTLPSFSESDENYCLAFLYPEDFSGFILQADPEKNFDVDKNGFLITSKNRGIPVLVPQQVLNNLSESKVTITGVLSQLPDSVFNLITRQICDTRESLYYGFLRQSSRRIGFCIDCRSNLNSDINKVDKIRSLPAALYVEGHFENVVDDKYKDEFIASIPRGINKVIGYEAWPGKKFYMTEDENVAIMGAFPSVFGFYAETNVADQYAFDKKVKELREFYSKFWKSVSSKIRTSHSHEVKFKLDFLFDYSRQQYFHPDGVLASKESDAVIDRHKEYCSTVEWLRNAK